MRTRNESPPIPCAVLGGSGYVAGELLRLLAGHPRFEVAAVVSSSRGGEKVTESFPHLAATSSDALRFVDLHEVERLLGEAPETALVSALPHGEAAARLDALLTVAEAAGNRVRTVDLSADFRHANPARHAEIYGSTHPAPERLARFRCELPELAARRGEIPGDAVAHPGCFTTAAVLALAPLVDAGLLAGTATVVAVTGSTGSGRQPSVGTHHPDRRSDLRGYAPAGHRHEPEMTALLARWVASGAAAPAVTFLPHSGPFARGIHATISAPLAGAVKDADLADLFRAFYPEEPGFVRWNGAPPRLAAVAGSNRCDLWATVRGDQVVVWSALDNLVKGAAGGAVQWMNRMFGFAERTGLDRAGLGWL